MPTSVIVSGREFRTKSEAKAFYGSIRDRYADGVSLDSMDAALLLDLLAIHPEAENKIGAGVSHFSVTTDNVFGRTRHFVVHRLDKTSTDFSFHACIDGQNTRRDVLESLRRAIESDIIKYRISAFSTVTEIVCPFLGTPLRPDSCHVDHAPPLTFLKLVTDWLVKESMQLGDVSITHPQDNQLVATMTNPIQRESWITYHRENARLRLTSPLANLSHSKKSAK